MKLKQFLQDLKEYNELHKNDGYILTIDRIIDMVEEEINENDIDRTIEFASEQND